MNTNQKQQQQKLFINKMEWKTDMYKNMGESQNHYALV